MATKYPTASIERSPSMLRMIDILHEKLERGHSSILFHPDGRRRRPLPRPVVALATRPERGPRADPRRTPLRVRLEAHFAVAAVERGYLARELAEELGARADAVSLALGNMKRTGLVRNERLAGGARRLWYPVRR